jgi:hypothetical protein
MEIISRSRKILNYQAGKMQKKRGRGGALLRLILVFIRGIFALTREMAAPAAYGFDSRPGFVHQNPISFGHLDQIDDLSTATEIEEVIARGES